MLRAILWTIPAALLGGCATPRTNSTLELDNGTRLTYVAGHAALEHETSGCVIVVPPDDPGPDLTHLAIVGFLEARIPELERSLVEDTGVDRTLANRALSLGAEWVIVLSEHAEEDFVVQRAVLARGQETGHTGGGVKVCR